MDGLEHARGEEREPAFNAPLPPLVLALGLLGLFAVQDLWDGLAYALVPAEAYAGRWSGLVTSLFIHGGWAHVVLNSLGLLAFGAPISRLLGSRAGGVAAFLLFYLACGVLAGAAYVALHPGDTDRVVGASGAVAGLMGASSRLLRGPYPDSLLSPPVLGMGAAWLLINLIAAVVGTLPGAGGAAIAWEAHLAGYAAGLLLVTPLAFLARRFRR